MEVAVLGLGEAGGRIAADLVAAGCSVRGWDPVQRPAGIENAASEREAVSGAAVIVSLTTAGHALEAAAGVAGDLEPDAVYADLNTAAPQLKRDLAAALHVRFADVALIGTVPATRPDDAGARLRRRTPRASPSSSGRSECPSTWSVSTPATPLA